MSIFTIPKPEKIEVSSSNRHLPISKVTTFAPGTLIPILCKDILPGDKVRINIDSLIESLPMIAPNLQGYKASFDFYFEPWSNFYGWMDNNNRSTTAQIIDRKRHYFEVTPQIPENATIEAFKDRPGVKAGSLLDYLGVPPGFVGFPSAQSGTLDHPGIKLNYGYFPAEKLLSVLDIYRTYYVNNQESEASFIANQEGVGRTGTDIMRVNLKTLDKLFIVLRSKEDGVNLHAIQDSLGVVMPPLYQYGDFFNYFIRLNTLTPLGGLPLRTYRMDLNRGLLSQEVGQLKSTVAISDGGFSIDTLRFANKLQKLIDRIDISGGRFSDMMRARWGVTPRGSLDTPDYLGSVSEFFGITDVLATASGTNPNVEDNRGNSVLGQQAGFAVNRMSRRNAPISFRADQYGTLVCMFSLVPIVTYSQGIEKEDLKRTFADVYDPAFGQLGYQDVNPLELSALPSFDFARVEGPDSVLPWANSAITNGASVGKRVAWSEYMSSLPRAHGLFAYGQDFDYWANNRLYTVPADISGFDADNLPDGIDIARNYGLTTYSTYIDPSLQNNLFADTELTAQNFRLRVNFDIFMRRNIGSRIMPHL